MRFFKYEGLGNDFIVLDRLAGGPEPSALDAVQWCDRRFGIGADGVLIIAPGRSTDFAMRVLNADGSVPEMCGNGLRCVGRHLAQTRGFTAGAIETGAGPLHVEVGVEVTIGMGRARTLGTRTVGGHQGQMIDMGNPHFVLFGAWTASEFERLGRMLVAHPDFERGANISFATQRGPTHIDLRVWERGAGPTLACGTGACATAAAAWLEGRTDADALRIVLPGGALNISGSPADLQMQGPARKVFEGIWSG